MKKCPSSNQRRGSNSQPSDYESPPLTTGPGPWVRIPWMEKVFFLSKRRMIVQRKISELGINNLAKNIVLIYFNLRVFRSDRFLLFFHQKNFFHHRDLNPEWLQWHLILSHLSLPTLVKYSFYLPLKVFKRG